MSQSTKMEDNQDNLLCRPPEIREIAKSTVQNLVPDKSREEYMKQYEKFVSSCNQNNVHVISEHVRRYGQFTRC